MGPLLGLVLGVFVGNMLIYKFLHGLSWLAAVGSGALAGVICFVLVLIFNHFARTL